MTAVREEAADRLYQRKAELPATEEIKEYVRDCREFLEEGPFPERRALIRNFVKDIDGRGDEVTLTYNIPMTADGTTSDGGAVLDFVQSGLPRLTRSRTFTLRLVLEL